MGKSSASLKKKRSKKSSKAKASSRSKSKKCKSRKIHRSKVSFSSSGYDDSASLNTSASLSSEDGYRRTRDRSRTRKDVKGRNKRAWRCSYSCDSSEDSLRARKRTRVKRKNDYEVREKPYRRKKPRKEVSVGSLSSRSWSCSTCQGESSSSDDSEFESRRERLKRKEKEKRRLKKGRSGSEKSGTGRYRARSCSSCSSHSESHDEGPEENHIGVNNSRWLRSVITATKEVEESGELYRNETKEEIVEDHDYPCRSNDSNDGGIKRESDYHTLAASEGKLRVEDEIGNANADFNSSEPKIRDNSYNDSSNLRAYGTRTSESIEKSTSETSGDNPNCDDLESILRQRALENLRKFGGGIKATAKASDQKNKIISHAKQPITEKHEMVQGKSIVNNAAVEKRFNEKTLVEETSLPSGRKELISYPRNNDRILIVDKGKSDSNKPHSTCAPEKVINADNPSEKITESSNYRTNNPELTKPESCHELLQSRPSLEQIPVSAENTKDRVTFEGAHVVSQSSNDNMNKTRVGSCETSASNGPPHTKSLVTEIDVEKDAGKNSQAAIESINNSSRVVHALRNSATLKSCLESSSVENSSDKLQDESNQGSQFEQKTMNVMRGGEMVQVSYKVFIPKKAPALARRQLKR